MKIFWAFVCLMVATCPVYAEITVAYRVSAPIPTSHFFEITMTISGLTAKVHEGRFVDLKMPVWTPGGYQRDNQAGNVLFFEALANEKHLTHEKVTASTWRVVTGGAGTIVLRYKVFANSEPGEPYSARCDGSGAYFNGARLFLYVDGKLDLPVRVTLDCPAGWTYATSLEPAGEPNVFRADNYDILCDDVVKMGTLQTFDFSIHDGAGRSVPMHAVLDSDNDFSQTSLSDLRALSQAAADLFEEIPFETYTFFYNLAPKGHGGLEHLNSTVIGLEPFGFDTPKGRASFLGVSAHEFCHTWNVKRLRPEGLGPFDYEKETYVKTLYLAEGFTSYYAWVVLARAGLYAKGELLAKFEEQINWCEDYYGTTYKSLEDYSVDAWLRSDFPYVSFRTYYRRGSLTALCLDLEIRHRTKNRVSLDAVMRYLYRSYYKKGKGYPPDALQQACEALTQTSFEEFFGDYVRGVKSLAYARYLNYAGIDVRPQATAKAIYLGVEIEDAGGRVRIKGLDPEGPASRSGLSYGDEILAVDAHRVTATNFFDRAARHMEGPLQVTLFRSDRLHTVAITPVWRVPTGVRVLEMADKTEEAVALRQAWLGKNEP